MKIFIVLLILFILPAQSMAVDKWEKKDIAMQIIFLGFRFADWRQTVTITKNPDRYWEMNPLLGRHPSAATVDVYFIGTSLLHTAIVHVLPQEYRKIFQGVSIAISGAFVVYNKFSIGIKMDF
jgi:hypothetical protein